MTEESENEAGLFVCYNPSTMSEFARMMQNRNPNQNLVGTSSQHFKFAV